MVLAGRAGALAVILALRLNARGGVRTAAKPTRPAAPSPFRVRPDTFVA